MGQGNSKSVTRRAFVQTTAAAAAAASAFPKFVFGAADDRPLKVGLIGCGGRGNGAAHDCMAADPNTKVVALADIAKDRLDGCKAALKKDCGADIADQNCFLGMDAYKKIAEMEGLDYVILATPPYYRPLHFATCVLAGKNVFTEKPVGVDPVGIRKFIGMGEAADRQKLSVVAGTQRRHENSYLATIKRIKDGAIGDIVSAQCYWNMGQLWFRPRQEGWSESEWMHRDWVNWCWLSGDHIVEQHVHNLDVIKWVVGAAPEKVVAVGARARRVTGDQFDHFSADFYFPKNVHVHSMCRQVNGCANDVSERVIGTKGVSNCNGWITGVDKIEFQKNNAYVQEHKDLIAAIRSGKTINEAKTVAESTLCAIMARISAYTGKEVTWAEMMESKLELAPPDYPLTDENVKAHIPVPGKA